MLDHSGRLMCMMYAAGSHGSIAAAMPSAISGAKTQGMGGPGSSWRKAQGLRGAQ